MVYKLSFKIVRAITQRNCVYKHGGVEMEWEMRPGLGSRLGCVLSYTQLFHSGLALV